MMANERQMKQKIIYGPKSYRSHTSHTFIFKESILQNTGHHFFHHRFRRNLVHRHTRQEYEQHGHAPLKTRPHSKSYPHETHNFPVGVPGEAKNVTTPILQCTVQLLVTDASRPSHLQLSPDFAAATHAYTQKKQRNDEACNGKRHQV